MKKAGIILTLAISTLLIPSCKKKSGDPAPEEVLTVPSFTAKINGVEQTFSLSKYTINGAAIQIVGVDLQGNNINLGTSDSTYKFLGAYTITTFGPAIAMYTVINPMTQHVAKTGKLTITKLENDKISGTFYFEEENGVKVTEGVFNDAQKQ